MDIDLQGKNILVTREKNQAQDFADKIKHFGGNPYIVPLLKVSHVDSKNHLKILENLQQYEWIFFTSAHGVHCFFESWKRSLGARRLTHQKIAVVGTKTNEVLKAYGYQATFIPSTYNAETMAREFLSEYNPKKTILLVRGKLASPILPDIFTKAAISYDCLTVYETYVNDESKELLIESLHYSHLDYITFTSPSTVDAFFSLIENVDQLEGKKIVCIGTTTETSAKEKGLSNILVPQHFTIEGMIAEIGDHIAKKG